MSVTGVRLSACVWMVVGEGSCACGFSHVTFCMLVILYTFACTGVFLCVRVGALCGEL